MTMKVSDHRYDLELNVKVKCTKNLPDMACIFGTMNINGL